MVSPGATGAWKLAVVNRKTIGITCNPLQRRHYNMGTLPTNVMTVPLAYTLSGSPGPLGIQHDRQCLLRFLSGLAQPL